MANQEHLRIIKQGVDVWDKWREENLEVEPDLSRANLRMVNLMDANLFGGALFEANLSEADLSEAILSGANLNGAYLTKSILVKTNLENANLIGCIIYGISAWSLKISEKTIQSDLIITQEDEPIISVDNLEVAQFIYLLLHNEKIRQVIDAITSKVVLILGRFTNERKEVLDLVRDELRKRNYTPVLFDFAKPSSRNLTETISTLAHMARFVIADITDPRSIPQELQRIIPDLPSVPIQPLIQGSSHEYGMFEDFKDYPWVLAIHRYRNLNDLLSSLKEKVIAPAEAKVRELRGQK